MQTEAQEGKPIAEIPEMLKALKMAEEVETTSPNPFENLNQTEKMELASEEAEQQRIKALVSDSGLDEECLSQQENIAAQTHEMGYQFSREAGEVEQQIFRLVENMHKLPESKHEQIAINIAGLEKSLTELNKKKRDSYRQAEQIRSEIFTECRKSATQQSIRMVEVDDVGIYQSVEQDQPATDLSEQPTQQLSKFHKAALSGDTATISEILQIGTDVNESDDFGRTALMYATSRDHGAVVALLLEANADPNIQADDGTTALYLAVKRGFVDTISLLMEADADILQKGPTGKTAVDLARATFGNYEVVKQKTKNFAVLSLVNGETLKQADARIKIEDYVAYTKASELGTVVAFEEYLYTYPEGLHAEQARIIIANLEDKEAYTRAKETESIKSYQDYLSSFPQGRYRDEIGSLLSILQDDAAFAKASELGTVVAFEEYLSTYPEGLHVNNAIQLQEQARDKESFETAKEIGLSAAFAKYLQAYPQGQFTEEAKQLASQAKDSEAFAKVKNIGSVEAYETYLSVYGDGQHAEDARFQIEQLKDNAAFAKATESDTLLAYAEYLLSFPNGLHAEQARSVLANMEDTGAYVQAKETGSIESYQRYLSSFPQGRYKDEIASLLNPLQDYAAFAKASEAGTVAAFEEYLLSFPNGLHIKQAHNVIANLEETSAYLQAKETGSIKSYQGYLSSFPQGKYRDEINNLLKIQQEEFIYEKAEQSGSPDGILEYLSAFPEGTHVKKALAHLEKIETRDITTQAEQVFEPRKIFQDCSECPQMIVVPAGEITIGSPQSEEARGENEGPQYPVNIRNSFAVGLYEVTHGEFRTFIEQTGHKIENGCYSYNRKWRLDRDLNWQNPGFEKTDRSPIVCINWNDAKAYVNWLVEKTGRTYRLLSESEWEYVARAGTGTPFSTGATISTGQANYNGKYKYGYGKTGKDRKKATQVGSFSPNPFGLYDMHGNVYEWVEDCYNESYTNTPKDGKPWLKGNCDIRVLRGGSWNNAPALLRSSYRRAWHPSSLRYNNAGIRVARTLYTISGMEDRKLVQLCLDKQGYATGVPDGQFGIQARVAIRNWQEAQVKKGTPTEVTGYLTLFDVNAILENCKF